MNDVKTQVKTFLVESILLAGDGGRIRDETSLLEAQVLDSTGVLELVSFLEERFGVRVEDHELLPENLDSLAAIERFVLEKRAS